MILRTDFQKLFRTKAPHLRKTFPQILFSGIGGSFRREEKLSEESSGEYLSGNNGSGCTISGISNE